MQHIYAILCNEIVVRSCGKLQKLRFDEKEKKK